MLHDTCFKTGIVSLITVFAVGLLALGAVLAVTVGTLSELNKNQNAVSGDQTFYSAESGAREGAMRYIAATTTYAGGSAPLTNNVATSSITLIKNWPADWPYIYIRANAANSRNNRTIIRKITHFREGEGFEHAFFASGDLNIGGTVTIDGNIFTNGDININDGSVIVNGDIFYRNNSSIHPNATINGTVVRISSGPIPAPQIDDQPYKDSATAYFTNAHDAENFLKNSTVNGIVYIDTTEDINVQGTNLTGTLVALGNLKLTGTGSFNYNSSATSNPVIIARKNLTVGSGVTIAGVVFIKGTTSFAGNDSFRGAIISEGAINTSGGGTTIKFDPSLTGDWTKIPGLSTSSLSAPTVLNWSEE